jgi:hypothetical protein
MTSFDESDQPDEPNVFDQISVRPTRESPQLASAPAPPQQAPVEEGNPFDKISPRPVAEEPSATGAFVRGAARGVLPALGSLPAIGAGAEFGAAAGAPLGPLGAAAGGLVGGLAGAIGGASAIEAAQNYALKMLPYSWTDALGMSDRQEKLDAEHAPVASFLGGMTPYALTMRPDFSAVTKLPDNATAIQKLMAHPATARLFGGGVMGGMELGQEAIGPEPVDWRKVAISTGFGVVFNKPTRFGERLTEIGGYPARAVLGRPHPVPTVAEANDLNRMGPGVTEEVALGSHERDPNAERAANDTKRVEDQILEPEKQRKIEDLHSVVARANYDLFAEDRVLSEQAKALEGIPGQEENLAKVKAMQAELEPQIRKAYVEGARRAGAEIVEPAPPEAEAAGQVAETTPKDFFAEAASRNAQRRADAERIASLGQPIKMAHADGRTALVGPDVSKPGTWRVTRFDKSGPIGHTEYPDMRSAALDALQQGFSNEAMEIGVGENTKRHGAEPGVGSVHGGIGEQDSQRGGITEPRSQQPRKATGEENLTEPAQTPQPIQVAPGVPVAPPRPIEQQRAAIVADRKAQLIEAGRPADEAQAGAELTAARYEARAAQFKGALGTAEELYNREASDIQKMGKVANKVQKFKSPYTPRVADNLLAERLAAGRERAQERRNEGTSAVRLMTTAERYAGVTEEEFKAHEAEALKSVPEKDRAQVHEDLSLLDPDEWSFMEDVAKRSSEPRLELPAELFQRRTAPPEPNLFTQREAEGQANLPGTTPKGISQALSDSEIAALGAKPLPEDVYVHNSPKEVINLSEGGGSYGGAIYLQRSNAFGEGQFGKNVHAFLVKGKLIDTESAEFEHEVERWLQTEDEKGLLHTGYEQLVEKHDRDYKAAAHDLVDQTKAVSLIEDEGPLMDLGEHLSEEGYAGVKHGDAALIYDPAALESYHPIKTEAGAEGKPQLVLPGAEKVSESDLAKRRAAEPLKPGVAQKPMDIGLFSDQAAQRELFSRGALGSLLPREGERPLMKLAKNANASTFIHESGHEWLEQLMKDDAHPLAPADLKADAKTVRDWLGIESHADLNTGWPGERGQKARAAHEKFARGFEQYLRLGVAPSESLARVFAKFRDWLTQLYKTLRGLGEPINHDIRAVFDRMLSTNPQHVWISEHPIEEHVRPGLADIHAADAKEIPPHEAEGAMDRVAEEAYKYYKDHPHGTGLEPKVAAGEAEAAHAAGEGGAGPAEGGEVGPGGPPAEPGTGGGGAGGDHEEVGGSGTGARPQGAGVQSAERGPGGGEEPGTLPLASSPAPDFSTAGNPFNVGLKGNVRTENMTSVPQFLAALDESAKRIPGGGHATMGEVYGLAQDMQMDPAMVDMNHLAQMFGGLQNLSSKIIAFRETVKAQAKTVSDMMKRVRDGGGTQADVLAFAKERARLDMFMSVMSSVTTEMGRGLGMGFRNMEGWDHVKDVHDFLKKNTGRTLFQLEQIAKLGAELNTPQQVVKFMKDSEKRSFGMMILEYWINGLISGPATHSTYAVGNEILAMEKMGPETAAAAGIGAIRKALGREGDTVRIGEVPAQLQAHFRALPSSLKAAVEAFRSGVTTRLPGEGEAALLPFQPGTELAAAPVLDESAGWHDAMASLFGTIRGARDGIISTAALLSAGGVKGAPMVSAQFSHLGAIPDIAIKGVPVIPLGSTIRLPGRFIAAIHSFFRSTNYSVAKAAIAYRTAANDPARLTGTAFDAKVAEVRQNPNEQQMEQARAEATNLTLMGNGSDLVRKVSTLMNHQIKVPFFGNLPILKFIDPFVHISANILNQTIVQRTPVGILTPEIRADLMGRNGTVAQDMAAARMLMGSLYAIGVGSLAAEGLISGSGPSEPDKARVWRQAGNQPHSIAIGDIWYDAHKLGPMGLLVGISADLYEVAHLAAKDDYTKAAAALHHAFTQNILDESFMRGPAELIRAVEDPGRYGESYIRNFLAQFVPFSVGSAQIARAMDPYTREARTITDAMRAKIPGLSESLMPRRDIWGEPMPSRDALLAPGVTAIYMQKISHDPVNIALAEMGIGIKNPIRKIRNVELTDQQYDDFARISGQMSKQRLDVIVRSPDWQTWPAHIRQTVVTAVIDKSREAARGMMMMKYPQIVVDATAEMKKKHGIEE